MAAALTSRTWRLPAGIYLQLLPDFGSSLASAFFYHFHTLPFFSHITHTSIMSNTCKLPSIRLLSLDLPLPGQHEHPYSNPAAMAGQHPHYQAYPQSYEPLYYNMPGVHGTFSVSHAMGQGPALGNLGATPLLTNLLFVGPGHEQLNDRLVSPYHHPVPQSASAAYSFQTHAPSRLPSSVASVSGMAHSDAESEHKPVTYPPVATAAPVVANEPAACASTPTTVPVQAETPAETPPAQLLSPSATPQPLGSTLPESPRDSSWKPRKKRQCPECHLYFSNLATHKSTHLKPTNRPHLCKLCHRGFARPNDLFRHFKCHWKEIGADKGQFRCPFKTGAADSEDHCCHTLGIFSRCDTYKNHLKAIHFQYPSGTKKSQRNNVPGSCRLCQKQFTNVDDWITNHIDTNECPFASH